MEREENSDPIPIDIILEILSRSSTKTIARFGLASKSCKSILSRPDFTKLFSARSTTRRRLLFPIENSGKIFLYSPPQTQNPYEKHSLVAADFHMQFLGDITTEGNICGSLLCFSNMKISKEDRDSVSLICNPSTGQYVRLPPLKTKSDMINLLGYDPIGKQYKVLALSTSLSDEKHILTLGTGKVSWRKMECNVCHWSMSNGICINGVLYYIADQGQGEVAVIACFDVRSENFRFNINTYSTTIRNRFLLTMHCKMIIYKGKFGVISWGWYRRRHFGMPDDEFETRLWLRTILEDAQTQEWLIREYNKPVNIIFEDSDLISVFGVTSTDEIVLSVNCTSKSQFFVIYFNPEKNTLKEVEIQGFEALNKCSRVHGFVDYAEDFKFI